MSITSIVQNDIAHFEPGKLFTYRDIPTYRLSPASTIKTMGKLVREGGVRRFSKGHFYRPKQGIFGEIRPSDSEKIKSLLYKNGKLAGYVTGLSLYNRLGLTTQVPGTLTIATEKARQVKDLGNMVVKMVPARAPVNAKNVPALEFLDALADIRIISDATPTESLRKLMVILQASDRIATKKLIELALEYYAPSTKALLGLVLDITGVADSQRLYASLNVTTRYKIGIDEWPLATKKWNIE
ncbi:DUF6088 family protein [Erwiniaceae bacterium L1_54_6]|jgi:hypothetical protein|nr:DUF6088 family protein [Erwiniaceae bacterium L1_54_6]